MTSLHPIAKGTFKTARNLEMFVLSGVGRLVPQRSRQADDDRLRILAHVPSFIPVQRAGAEPSEAMEPRALSARGHTVRVIVDRDGITGQPEDLEVVAHPSMRQTVDAYRWADIVFTQLASRNMAMRLGALTSRPVAHFLRLGGVDIT